MGEFRDILRRAVENGATPEDAYDAAVEAVGKDQLAAHFRQIGVDEARHLRRQASRRIENHIFGGVGRPLVRTKSEPRTYDIRSVLVRLTWSRGDGTTVAWLTATREEHRDRIADQERLIGAIQDDIDRHRKALKVLDAAGVDTLAELDDDALAEVVE